MLSDLKKRLIWIGVASVLMGCLVALALVLTGPTSPSIAFAAALGTFFSFALSGGLFTALFYSADSGSDGGVAITLAKPESHQPAGDDSEASGSLS